MVVEEKLKHLKWKNVEEKGVGKKSESKTGRTRKELGNS